MSLDAVDETFPEMMMMKVLLYSFRFQNQSLFPIYTHKKYKIFDEHKVMTYAKANIIDVSTVKTEVISGSSQEEFTQEFGKTLGLEASAVTPLATAEIKSSRSTSENRENKTSRKYSQSRLQVTKKFLRFQSAITDVKTMKDFLDKKVFEQLLEVKTPNDADQFLTNYGRFYLTQVHVGGLRTYASADESKFSEHNTATTTEYQNTQTAANAPVKLGSNFKNSAKKGTSRSKDKSEINATTLGGIAENFASDRETWIASIAEGNYAICQCKFKPMYVLIPKQGLEGEGEEQLLKARKLLKDSHMTTVEASNEDDEDELIEDGKEYSVQNQAYDNYYLNPKLPSESSTSMTVLENFCEAHADQEVYRSSDMRISLQKGRDFLGGSKKLFSAKAHVSLGKDADRMSTSNQWILHQVRNRQGSYFLKTSSSPQYMLGLKRCKKNGESEYEHKYVMKKFSKKTEENTLNFMWKFKRKEEETENFKSEEEQETEIKV